MKVKIIFLGLFILALNSSNCIAQSNPQGQSIISTKASIRVFYENKALQEMQKGELVELYIERMKVMVRILPKMALATKPGVTLSDLAIPNIGDNKKAFEAHKAATQQYIDLSVDFLRKMLPYCDKGQLISSILFYEQVLKSLKEVEAMDEY